MERTKAVELTKELLNKHGLSDYKVRITTDVRANFAGKHYEFPYKMIVLNGLMIDVQPEPEIMNTIMHEVAHAIVGNKEGHNDIWRTKAIEIGCKHTGPCAAVPTHILDAIRSGHLVEVDYEIIKEKRVIEEDVIKPKYTITRLQDLCPVCGKVAKERFSFDKLDPKDGEMYRWITYECFHVFKKHIHTGTKYHTMVSNQWKPEISSCIHKWGSGADDDYPKTQCVKCGEYKLYDFQVASGHFLDSALSTHKGGLLGHDMGLGKTVIALAYIKFHTKECTPVLYIVKSKTRFQWLKEIMRWVGPDHLGQIIETGRDTILPGLKSYIISYDLLRRIDRSKLQALGLKLVILDECQQIKNVDSTRTSEVRKLIADPNIKVIPMSGTFWKNRGTEVFPAMNMIAPTLFSSPENFKKRWVDYYFHGNQMKEGGIRNPKQFREYTKDIFIRYEYDEVMTQAPAIKRTKLPVQLDEIATEAYNDATSDFVAWYNQHLIDGTEDKLQGIEILAQMARMRHITGLAKIAATVEFCDEFYDSTNRSIIIFVHHKDVGYHLQQELIKLFKDKTDVVVETLTAAKGDIGNNKVASNFGTDNKRWFVVASTLACGEGIDGLQKGCDSILHERQWNPQNEDQATPGRLKRIGQKAKTINITCVEADETIDIDLDEIVERKRKQFHAMMNTSVLQSWNTDDAAKDLANKIVERWKKKGKTVKNKNIKKLATIVTREESMIAQMFDTKQELRGEI
jgi:hypothetical protein